MKEEDMQLERRMSRRRWREGWRNSTVAIKGVGLVPRSQLLCPGGVALIARRILFMVTILTSVRLNISLLFQQN